MRGNAELIHLIDAWIAYTQVAYLQFSLVKKRLIFPVITVRYEFRRFAARGDLCYTD